MTILCVGAGFSGAVIARELAEAGLRVDVVEARDHVAGNCHSSRDPATDVLVHRYGPHIFHTDDAQVWAYVNRFAKFRPYRHQVKTLSGGAVYSMPINLHTINQFFGRSMTPDEAKTFIAGRTVSIPQPESLEEQALSMVGPEIYEAFLKGYTEKQWGRAPSDLPASILKRLPLRFSYDDNYFFHRFQGMPEQGYTPLVTGILDHPLIDLHLNSAFDPARASRYDHIFWSGPLDAWFGHDFGHLGYRTLDFSHGQARGSHQGAPIMNYADTKTPYTRVTEHKYFAPWESHEETVFTFETPREFKAGDIPYYPIRLLSDKSMLTDYVARAALTEGVTFCGRLGTYRYLDMDVTIREALETAQAFLKLRRNDGIMPAFIHPPIPQPTTCLSALRSVEPERMSRKAVA